MANGDRIHVRRHTLPHVEMYDVTADELDRIESESGTVGQDLQYSSNCFTAAVAFLVALCSTNIPSRPTFDTFVILTICGFVFAIYFGQKYLTGKKNCGFVFQRIRDRKIGPVGEEGNELKPAEVAQMAPISSPVPPQPQMVPQPQPVPERTGTAGAGV